jgi:hypothetical protein
MVAEEGLIAVTTTDEITGAGWEVENVKFADVDGVPAEFEEATS